MRDLFDIFPDLPWAPRISVDERVREVRAHAERVRREISVAAKVRKALAERRAAVWRRQIADRQAASRPQGSRQAPPARRKP